MSEKLKAWHHKKAAYEDAVRRTLITDIDSSCDAIANARAIENCRDELEAFRVASIQLDLERDEQTDDMADVNERVAHAAIAAHNANERLAREQTTAWLERTQLTRALRATEEEAPQ